MEPTRVRDFEMQQLRLFCSSKSLLGAVIKENVTFWYCRLSHKTMVTVICFPHLCPLCSPEGEHIDYPSVISQMWLNTTSGEPRSDPKHILDASLLPPPPHPFLAGYSDWGWGGVPPTILLIGLLWSSTAASTNSHRQQEHPPLCSKLTCGQHWQTAVSVVNSLLCWSNAG